MKAGAPRLLVRFSIWLRRNLRSCIRSSTWRSSAAMRSCLLSSMHCSLVMVSSTLGGRPSPCEAAGHKHVTTGPLQRRAGPRRLSPDAALLGVSSCTASEWKFSHLMMRSSSCSCFSHDGEHRRSLVLTELESISTHGEYADGSCCHTDIAAHLEESGGSVSSETSVNSYRTEIECERKHP